MTSVASQPLKIPSANTAQAAEAYFRAECARRIEATLEGVGLSEAHLADKRRELEDHLWSSREGFLQRGYSPTRAGDLALSGFGGVERVRRRFLFERFRQDAREAWQMPTLWTLLIGLDVVGVIVMVNAEGLSRWQSPGVRAAATALYCCLAVLVDWGLVVLLRVAARSAVRGFKRRAFVAEGLAGVALSTAVVGLGLRFALGFAMSAACLGLQSLMGRETSVSLPLLACGFTWSLALYAVAFAGPSGGRREPSR